MSTLRTLTVNGKTYGVVPVVPAASVNLLADDWVGSEDAYSQVVELAGVTSRTKVDLQPTHEQVEIFLAKTLAFVAENNNGVVTVYSIGHKPQNNYTIQVTMTEVEGGAPIRGNTVGLPNPQPDWNQNDPTKADYIKNKPSALDGEPGNDGKSAYEYACDGGFQGTEPEFASLLASSVEHTKNKDNPHNITAVQIGAAPAGYGLGAIQDITVDALNGELRNGWYRIADQSLTVAGYTCTNWHIHVSKYGSTYLVQEMYPLVRGYNYKLIRWCSAGTWAEEWVNPPMSLGVEYCTTERCNRKAVYTKLVDYGELPNKTSKTVVYCGSGSTGLVSLTAMLSDGNIISAGYGRDSGKSVTYGIFLDGTLYNVRMQTEADFAGLTATVLVKYTKD